MVIVHCQTKGQRMRSLTDHITNPANDKLTIAVMDEPGSGGANHLYVINGFNASTNLSLPNLEPQDWCGLGILFQNGPINEVGVNGITHEALLTILIDRLRGFQNGPFKSKANACALTHMEEALMWLNQRTLERMRRGVEGTHKA